MQKYSPFSDMPEYAFPRLRRLLSDLTPGSDPIDMSIGEPKHKYPDFINEIILSHLSGLNKYPPNDGYESLLNAMGEWTTKRYELQNFDYHNCLIPLNGSREGLFNAALSLFPRLREAKKKYIILPNPFYQCYLAASIAANAQPIFVTADSETNFLPNFNKIPKNILEKTGIFFVCSPSNPQGGTATEEYWKGLINLSEKHNFRIFSDECYSEIYRDKKPIGVLSVAKEVGADLEKISVFQSLSKRSNLPGIRSGFSVNGKITTKILRNVRAYGGAPLPIPFQLASEKVWRDETHVEYNRFKYNEKFKLANEIFEDMSSFKLPNAGFFICLQVRDIENFTKQLWVQKGVKVLPGPYLCNLDNLSLSETEKISSFARIALVGLKEEVDNGLKSVKSFLDKNRHYILREP